MKDQRVEEWLNSFRLPWTYVEEISLEDILVDKNAKENIRMTERLDEDLVVRYSVALENGAHFPGIVLFESRNAKNGSHYELLNGWHRMEAFRLADRKTISAYITKVEDRLLISVLRRTANTYEGKPLSMPELIEQAVFIVRQGYSIADAARLMSVPSGRLGDRILAEQVRGRLAKMGVDTGELSVSTTSYTRLSQLRDPHLKQLVLLAHEARFGHEQLMEYARQVREAPSDKRADELLEEWRRLHAGDIARNRGGAVASPGSPLRRLPALLKRVERSIAVDKDKAVALRPEEVDALISACHATIAKLQAMILHLKHVKSAVAHA